MMSPEPEEAAAEMSAAGSAVGALSSSLPSEEEEKNLKWGRDEKRGEAHSDRARRAGMGETRWRWEQTGM